MTESKLSLICVRQVLRNNASRYITLPFHWADDVERVAVYTVDDDTLLISRKPHHPHTLVIDTTDARH